MRQLKGVVGERLWGVPQNVIVALDEARVGVVLDVVALDQLLNAEDGLPGPVAELKWPDSNSINYIQSSKLNLNPTSYHSHDSNITPPSFHFLALGIDRRISPPEPHTSILQHAHHQFHTCRMAHWSTSTFLGG